jgi:sensor histidine kinase regulating citrate/malate metabolism
VNSKSKNLLKIKKLAKRFKQNVIFLLLLFIVLMGTWCVPPKWTEKVVQELKAKYIVEKLEEKKS